MLDIIVEIEYFITQKICENSTSTGGCDRIVIYLLQAILL